MSVAESATLEDNFLLLHVNYSRRIFFLIISIIFDGNCKRLLWRSLGSFRINEKCAVDIELILIITLLQWPVNGAVSIYFFFYYIHFIPCWMDLNLIVITFTVRQLETVLYERCQSVKNAASWSTIRLFLWQILSSINLCTHYKDNIFLSDWDLEIYQTSVKLLSFN